MSVTLELEPKVLKSLKERAESVGSPFDEYVTNVLSRHVDREENYERIMSPLWNAFKESGMTEEELDVIVESERQTVWDEKHGNRS